MRPDALNARAQRLARRVTGRGAPMPPRPVVPELLLELAHSGPAPLAVAHSKSFERLQIAIVVPSFRRGSGGHGTIVNLAKELVRRGHSVSLWLDDFERLHVPESDATTERRFAEFFNAAALGLRTDFSSWHGADVVLATGWQTIPQTLLLPGAASRAYLVQDHEPDFYGASAQSTLAAETYRLGLHCIAASEWLAELLRTRYGASASHFDLALDHSIYHPTTEPRRPELIAFYGRSATPRRGVALGLLGLQELAYRRPGVEIALFGSDSPAYAPFPHTDLGVLDPAQLAALYGRATVGMVFSLTNPSLIGLEMMACGLPCVELASESMRASFGTAGPLRLAPPDPVAISGTIAALLDDLDDRKRAAKLGRTLVETRTWSRAAEQVEQGLSTALAS